MSMNTCFKCGEVYDTDWEMETINGEMVCDNCFEDWEQEQGEELEELEKTVMAKYGVATEEQLESGVVVAICILGVAVILAGVVLMSIIR